ncbi:UTRA domain-containing protein [Neobacillus sp. MER 74]|uniref:UTRA domain-containing protein n=1 Tax=Bacillaceae TaxID=186817 RepID=UPI000BF91CDF|nr:MULTISPECIES: UTRA domain-containing protein [Bacillaceae]MCM3118496.1 UTRA domain-containing protein [Neobacillus sp. MER 74]PFP23479.1 GntR family transcriptional regulator [Bacillus sp. AFS073361]
MTRTKYDKIYRDLKDKIENKVYAYQDLLPSEYTLVEQYECSRNTIRRAIANLVSEGYVQSLHGKGVRVIYDPYQQAEYILGGVETFKESSIRNKKVYGTKVVCFQELIVDKEINKMTSIPEGTEIYYIQRLRLLDEKVLIIDHNYFRRDVVKHLTEEIAKGSIYEYIENELGENIVTTKRFMTVEKANVNDEKYIGLNGYNCVAVINNYTFNAKGIMFEFTQSRHKPDSFVFFDQAQRIKKH